MLERRKGKLDLIDYIIINNSGYFEGENIYREIWENEPFESTWSNSSTYGCNGVAPNVVDSNPAQARCIRYNIMW